MRTDFDPKVGRGVAFGEGLATVILGLAYPFAYLPTQHASVRSRDIRTTVFVHGLAANRTSFFAVQSWLALRGFRRQLAVNLKQGPSIEAMAVSLKGEIDRSVKGGRIDIVAHSLGGLISRVYIQALGGDRRVDRLVTLGTPHYGTYAAMWMPTRFVRQLAPDGSFLRWLNDLPWPERCRVVSFSAGGDHLVLPRRSAQFQHGAYRSFDRLGHTGLLLAPAVLSAVERELRA